MHAPDTGDPTYQILGLSMRMHSRLGPGLLESAYECCVRHGFDRHAITWARQVDLPLDYGGTLIDCGCRADIIVDHAVILELKSVEQLLPLHEAQLLTYLRLSRCRFGLLFNSKTLSLKDGIRRRILSDHNPISDDLCRYCSATRAALATADVSWPSMCSDDAVAMARRLPE